MVAIQGASSGWIGGFNVVIARERMSDVALWYQEGEPGMMGREAGEEHDC